MHASHPAAGTMVEDADDAFAKHVAVSGRSFSDAGDPSFLVFLYKLWAGYKPPGARAGEVVRCGTRIACHMCAGLHAG